MENKFHEHLDICEQCEQHPFNLCPIGAELLVQTVNEQDPVTEDDDRISSYREPDCFID